MLLDPVFEDPAPVLDAFTQLGPYELLQGRAQVMTSALEQAAITGAEITDELIASVADPARSQGSLSLTPVFRGYWMLDGEPRVEGIEWLVNHPHLVEAARMLHGGDDRIVVRPNEIYAHLVCPDDRSRRATSHVDIPNFRGLGRRDHPTWLLTTMRRSGLFDRWHVPVAVAVIWFYRGGGGHYTYWPHGPDGPAVETDGGLWNRAVVGENDTMFHTGHPPEPAEPVPTGLSTSSVLEPDPADADRWRIVDDGRELAVFTRRRIRFALSWSALVLADDEVRRRLDDHTDDLDLGTVVDVFRADLARKGIDVTAPDDPGHDPAWVATLGRAYRVVPRAVAASSTVGPQG